MCDRAGGRRGGGVMEGNGVDAGQEDFSISQRSDADIGPSPPADVRGYQRRHFA